MRRKLNSIRKVPKKQITNLGILEINQIRRKLNSIRKVPKKQSMNLGILQKTIEQTHMAIDKV